MALTWTSPRSQSGSNKSHLSTVSSCWLFPSTPAFMKSALEIRIRYNFCENYKTWQQLRKMLDSPPSLSLCLYLSYTHTFSLYTCGCTLLLALIYWFSIVYVEKKNPNVFLRWLSPTSSSLSLTQLFHVGAKQYFCRPCSLSIWSVGNKLCKHIRDKKKGHVVFLKMEDDNFSLSVSCDRKIVKWQRQ